MLSLFIARRPSPHLPLSLGTVIIITICSIRFPSHFDVRYCSSSSSLLTVRFFFTVNNLPLFYSIAICLPASQRARSFARPCAMVASLLIAQRSQYYFKICREAYVMNRLQNNYMYIFILFLSPLFLPRPTYGHTYLVLTCFVKNYCWNSNYRK